MVQQIFFKSKYCRLSRVVLTIIIGMTFFSCSPEIHVSVKKPYPPREDNDSVVIYKKKRDIPIESQKIGTLNTSSWNCWEEACDSAFVLSLAKTKINRAGGNALLITKYENNIHPINSTLELYGDILFVSDFSSPPDTTLSFEEKYMYAGFGVGPETGFALPKISYYNFQNRKSFETYYGIEASVWLFFAFSASLNGLYGVKKDSFTFDTSLGAWYYPKSEASLGPYFHTTFNPKIGFKFKGVWLKAGPSIHLYRDYPKEQERLGIVDFVKIGNMYFNFEILIKI